MRVQKLLYLLRPFMRWLWSARLVGHPESIPESGPALIASNHTSFGDPWFIGIAIQRRYVRYLINRRWYERSPLWRRLFESAGALPVQSGDRPATVATVRRALARGDIVGIFPEGHVSPDGRLYSFRTGIAWMAALSGVPVVPIGIRGAFHVLPIGRWIPRRGAISVHVGEPIRFTGRIEGPEPEYEDLREFTNALWEAVRRLSGLEPASGPADPRTPDTIGIPRGRSRQEERVTTSV